MEPEVSRMMSRFGGSARSRSSALSSASAGPQHTSTAATTTSHQLHRLCLLMTAPYWLHMSIGVKPLMSKGHTEMSASTALEAMPTRLPTLRLAEDCTWK